MLTGDRELAQDLVQDVLVKAHGQWRRVSAADHPDRYVRTMLTRAFLSWRRRWAVRRIGLDPAGEVDGEPARDHAAGVVDRDDVWRRLARLPRQQRAVLASPARSRTTRPKLPIPGPCSRTCTRGWPGAAVRSPSWPPRPRSSRSPSAHPCWSTSNARRPSRRPALSVAELCKIADGVRLPG